LRFAPNIEKRLAALSPGERLKAQELLQGYQALRAQNPLLFYIPHERQQTFHASQAPIKAFMGGNRAGKTTAGIADDLIQAAPRELLPEHLLPYKRWECPFYCRIIVPDFKLALHQVVIQKLRDWTPKEMLRNGLFDSSYDKGHECLRFECGCRFDFMSFEQDVDKFGGAALHRCHYDEEPPEDIREECMFRLVDFNGDEIFTMTPLQGMSWMYDAIYVPGVGNKDPDIHIELADMDDNPHLSDEGKERALKGLSEQKAQARKKGHMVHFEGMVYPRFEETKVLPPDRRLVGSLEVVVGIDPGVREAGVVFVGFDRDNAAIVFDELEIHDAETSVICDRIRQKLKLWELDERAVQFVIDPAARQRTLTTAVSVETSYHMNGIYPAHGQNDREGGIEIIEDRIAQNFLQVSTMCNGLLWEAERYRRKFHEESGKWDVIKRHDHKLDALRYAICHRPWEVTGQLSAGEESEKKRRERRDSWKTNPDHAFPPQATRNYRRRPRASAHAI
jgi:phage terminase large subunit-like protein